MANQPHQTFFLGDGLNHFSEILDKGRAAGIELDPITLAFTLGYCASSHSSGHKELQSPPVAATASVAAPAPNRKKIPKSVVQELLLPSENSKMGVPNQGWLLESEVRQSTIEGNGRFAAEPIAMGSRVVAKPTIEMANIERLSDVPNDNTITFASATDIEKYIHLAREEGGHSRSAVMHELQHFIFGFDEQRACLNNSAWTMNHGEGPSENIIFTFETLEDGTELLVGDAYVDISAGTEVMNNYRDFIIAPWFDKWSKKNGLVDARTLVLNIADDGGHDNDPPRLPEESAMSKKHRCQQQTC